MKTERDHLKDQLLELKIENEKLKKKVLQRMKEKIEELEVP